MAAYEEQTTSLMSTCDAPPGLMEEQRERHRRALASLIPSFDPADPSVTLDLWFYKSQIIGSFLGYGLAEILPIMKKKLRGEARAWYEALSEADRYEWECKIVERFGTCWPAPKYIHMLATRKYRDGENIVLYFADKAALLRALGIHGRVAVECTVIETGLLEVEIDVQRRKIDDMRDLMVYFGQLEFNRTFRRTATLTDDTNILSHGTRVEKYKSLLMDKERYLDWQYAKIHLAERVSEERRRWGNDARLEMNVPKPQNVRGYKIPEFINSRIMMNAKVVSLGVEPNFRHEGRFFDVAVNGARMQAYLDNTCGCIALRRREAVLLGLPYHLINDDDHTWLRHYAQDDHLRFGPGCERPLGIAWYQIKIDQVTIMAQVYIVRTELLHVPLLIGQPFTRNTNTTIIECGGYVRVCETNSLVTMNSAVTDRSLQVRIGSDGTQPKVMTAQTVQAQKTGENDEAETCDPVSLVLDLEQRKEEEKKDQEKYEVVDDDEEEENKDEEEHEVVDKEEKAKEKKEEVEAETCGSVSLVLDLEQRKEEEKKDQEKDEVVDDDEEEENKDEEEHEVVDKEEKAKEKKEEVEAETCGSVSLVLDLEQRKEEEKKDQEKDEVVDDEEEEENKDEEEQEVVDKEEKAKEKKEEVEAETCGPVSLVLDLKQWKERQRKDEEDKAVSTEEKEEEDEVVSRVEGEEEDEVVSRVEEEEVEVWEGGEEEWEDEVCVEEDTEKWEEWEEEIMETEKEEGEKIQKKVQEEEEEVEEEETYDYQQICVVS